MISKTNVDNAHLTALNALDTLRRTDGDVREALEATVDALLILLNEFSRLVTGLQNTTIVVEADP